MVKHLGLDVRTAGDGREALAVITEGLPAAIILDLLMPVMDGFEVLRQLKRTTPAMLARVIVVTAATVRANEREEIDQVWRFFRKPLDIDEFGVSLLDCIRASTHETGRDGAYEAPSRP